VQTVGIGQQTTKAIENGDIQKKCRHFLWLKISFNTSPQFALWATNIPPSSTAQTKHANQQTAIT